MDDILSGSLYSFTQIVTVSCTYVLNFLMKQCFLPIQQMIIIGFTLIYCRIILLSVIVN